MIKDEGTDAVAIVRQDGKEFVVQRRFVAEHINRGFAVKHEVDQPDEEELSKAVGYRAPREVHQDRRDNQVGRDRRASGPAPRQGDEATVAAKKPARKKAVSRSR